MIVVPVTRYCGSVSPVLVRVAASAVTYEKACEEPSRVAAEPNKSRGHRFESRAQISQLTLVLALASRIQAILSP